MVQRICKHCSKLNVANAQLCSSCNQPFPASVEIFCSYTHADESLKDALLAHLSSLRRRKIVSIWHDRDISAGSDWEHNIDEHLLSAEIILLLISPEFMASDYCYSNEMVRAMKRYEKDEALVVPIILRPIDDWNSSPFGRLQAVPRNAKPITTFANRDEAFADVAKGIRKAIKESYGLPRD
ncbi:toll/interleukin-1 receptor domain-containing protein [Ktedonosporobacter rubrisoli]|uniref:Toll/interleukin-1 receptor domain-containing protein n=1 Tax=Ktedonosporobacter rubrisoli TaxID=2509675 RepID=A0A4P6JP00_KTERU|nr:toll/interleukin-1 receptor domain-containing protein [Ktedonosporobacter rubrisoli]QBD77069.1 toll/interleukin-1 receptor domain-containing protein [Ktedonosporobacter rubrisoli]